MGEKISTTRNQDNQAENNELLVQATALISDRLSMVAGLRPGMVRLTSDDPFLSLARIDNLADERMWVRSLSTTRHHSFMNRHTEETGLWACVWQCLCEPIFLNTTDYPTFPMSGGDAAQTCCCAG